MLKRLWGWIADRWQTRAARLETARWSQEVDRLAKRAEWLAREYPDQAGDQVDAFMIAHPTVKDRGFFTIWERDTALSLAAQLGVLIVDLEGAIYGDGE